MEKPVAIISMCSLGIPCQYRPARHVRRAFVDRLKERYHLVPVCPEQLGGLPTPRPARQMESGQVTSAGGQDFTAEYERGAALALEVAREMNARRAYLKKHSPSCDPRRGVTACLFRANGITVCGS